MNAAGYASPALHARSAGGAGDAGLVLSKTSLPDQLLAPGEAFVSSHPADASLRRLARLRRNILTAANLHGMADHGQRPSRPWFVTLTYAHIDGWRSDHVSRAVQAFRRWCHGHGVPCRYEWVAELQARGAVHYHLIAWLPARLAMPKWDKQRDKTGAVWWPHGMSNRQRCKSGAGYLAKYISKMGEFHRFPKGMRLYGVGGLFSDGRNIRSWWNLPEWARRLHGVGELVRKASRGLVVRSTEQMVASPYSVRRVQGGLIVRLVGAVAERFHDGPYSTYRGATC